MHSSTEPIRDPGCFTKIAANNRNSADRIGQLDGFGNFRVSTGRMDARNRDCWRNSGGEWAGQRPKALAFTLEAGPATGTLPP